MLPFQDIAVIPILAVLPLLTLPGDTAAGAAQADAAAHPGAVAALPGWAHGLVVVAFHRWKMIRYPHEERSFGKQTKQVARVPRFARSFDVVALRSR